MSQPTILEEIDNSLSILSSIVEHQLFDDQIEKITEKINALLSLDDQSRKWTSFGEVLFQLERDDDLAMSMIEKAIQLDDQNARAFFFKGLIAAVIPGRKDDEIPSFEKAVELKPSVGYFWLELGRAYIRNKMDDKALDSLKKYVEIDREDAIKRDVVSSFYNMGVRWFLGMSFEKALETFSIADELCEKTDLQLKGKIVQTLEKLGKLEERDEKIKELYKLYKNKSVGDQVKFCRDQFTLDSYQNKTNLNVFVFEYFELLGEMAVKYVFQVSDDKSILCKISLGSYTFTNQIHLELNSSQPDERVYHLDGYYPGMHKTFGFYSGTIEKPNITYEELKQKVLDILHEQSSAVSSSTFNQ